MVWLKLLYGLLVFLLADYFWQVYFRDCYQGVADFEVVYKRKLPFAPPRTTVIVSKVQNTDVQMEVIAVE
jgi:hypothetical protein